MKYEMHGYEFFKVRLANQTDLEAQRGSRNRPGSYSGPRALGEHASVESYVRSNRGHDCQ